MLSLTRPDAMPGGHVRGPVRPRVATPSRSRHAHQAHLAGAPTSDLDLGPLFVHARDAMLVGDVRTGRIVLWNPAAEQLFGYSSAEAIDRPMDMLMPPAVASLHRERLAHFARTGEADVLNSRECLGVPALTRDGEEIRTELSLIPLDAGSSVGSPLAALDAGSSVGSPRYVLLTFRDASQEKRAELQTLEVARAESARADAEARLRGCHDLVRDISRELEVALTRARRAAARLARMGTDARVRPERLVLMAWAVEAHTAVVQRTIEQLEDTAAIQSDTFSVRSERVNLVPLVARIVARTRRSSASHPLKMAAPQGLTAQADPQRIEQVVQTLVDQAIRRNPRGCWIDVDLRRPLAGLAQINVRDYGRPLSVGERDQLPGGRMPSREWYVCQHIVDRHGGTLQVEPSDEGGVRVSVTLPTNGGRVSRP